MGRVLRTVGLWILIIFTLSVIVTCFMVNCFPWNYVFLGIALWICCWELYGSIWGFEVDGEIKHRTISQMFWKFKEKHPKLAWLIVSLFAIAMLGLEIHLLA